MPSCAAFSRTWPQAKIKRDCPVCEAGLVSLRGDLDRLLKLAEGHTLCEQVATHRPTMALRCRRGAFTSSALRFEGFGQPSTIDGVRGEVGLFELYRYFVSDHQVPVIK